MPLLRTDYNRSGESIVVFWIDRGAGAIDFMPSTGLEKRIINVDGFYSRFGIDQNADVRLRMAPQACIAIDVEVVDLPSWQV